MSAKVSNNNEQMTCCNIKTSMEMGVFFYNMYVSKCKIRTGLKPATRMHVTSKQHSIFSGQTSMSVRHRPLTAVLHTAPASTHHLAATPVTVTRATAECSVIQVDSKIGTILTSKTYQWRFTDCAVF